MEHNEIIAKLREKSGNTNISFPKHICFSTEGNTLVVCVNGKGVRDNMQTDGSAFEGWAICILAWLPECCDRVLLKWDNPIYDTKDVEAQKKHYNRFVMRAMLFEEIFDWASVDKNNRSEIDGVKRLMPTLLVNYPKSDSKQKVAENDKIEKREAKLERQIFEVLKPVADHQLPVGLFKNDVCRDNAFTPSGASQIDLWQLENGIMRIFELKVENNDKVGIISELLFYANVIRLLVKGTIKYSDALKALRKNFRHIKELSYAIEHKEISSIEAIFLNYSFHPIIEGRIDKVLSILNSGMGKESVQFKYERVENILSL